MSRRTSDFLAAIRKAADMSLPRLASGNRHLLWRAGRTVEAHRFKSAENFFQRLLAEIRNAQQVISRTVQQISYAEDASLFQAIRCADRQANFGRAKVQLLVERSVLFFGLNERNAGHRGSLPSFVK